MSITMPRPTETIVVTRYGPDFPASLSLIGNGEHELNWSPIASFKLRLIKINLLVGRSIFSISLSSNISNLPLIAFLSRSEENRLLSMKLAIKLTFIVRDFSCFELAAPDLGRIYDHPSKIRF